jgi:NTE family protein
VKSRGFDVTPLRQLINESVDEEAIRKSDVDFYIITYSLSNLRSLELRASELEDGQLFDMLLASSYLPVFKNEKLGGKRYADGGVTDAVPIHALVTNGYKDIIVVRLYGFGLKDVLKCPEM